MVYDKHERFGIENINYWSWNDNRIRNWRYYCIHASEVIQLVAKKRSPLDALDIIDDVNELFLGIPKKRKVNKKDILSGDFLSKLD